MTLTANATTRNPITAACQRGKDLTRSPAHLEGRGTNVVEHTLLALRPVGNADPPTVPDQQMADHRPILAWDQFHEILFEFFRIGFPRETQQPRKPQHM